MSLSSKFLSKINEGYTDFKIGSIVRRFTVDKPGKYFFDLRDTDDFYKIVAVDGNGRGKVFLLKQISSKIGGADNMMVYIKPESTKGKEIPTKKTRLSVMKSEQVLKSSESDDYFKLVKPGITMLYKANNNYPPIRGGQIYR